MKRNIRICLTVCIFLLSLGIGLYFRLYPLLHFSASDATERASVYMVSRIKQNITQQVAEQYPRKSATEQALLSKRLLDQYLREEGRDLRERIDQLASQLDQHTQQRREFPYLLASDSYYYYALTLNILKKGTIAERIQGSKFFNKQTLAPHGAWEPLNLHPFVGFSVQKIARFFSPSLDLMAGVSFTPLVVTAFALAVFFLLMRLWQMPLFIILISSIFFLLAPIFVKRSMFGWYDNDPYNILFPLLILYFFFQSLKADRSIKRSVVFASFTLLTLVLYAYFWQGWVFLLSVLATSALTILIWELLTRSDREKTRAHLIIFGIIFIGDFLLISLLWGPSEFLNLFAEGAGALRNFLEPQLSIWPDLYISVSELHPSESSFLVGQMGGRLFIGIALIGFISSFTPLFAKHRPASITLLVYGLIAVAISLGAQRFVMLPLVPFSLAFALGMKTLYELLKKLAGRISTTQPRLQQLIRIFICTLLISTVLAPVVAINRSVASLLNPLFNETWEKALVKIKTDTPKEAIINAWWPPGHFIKAIARRAVTFDGGTISTPQAYWIANAFLAQEREALGILRMLNTSGNEAVERFEELGLDRATSILAVKDLTTKTDEEALSLIQKATQNETLSRQILRLTHGRPRPSYVLVYKEFVENNMQLKFIGDWNVRALQVINQDKKKLASLPSRRSPEFIQMLWTLAGGPYKYSGILAQINRVNSLIFFEENIKIDLSLKEVRIDSQRFGTGTPQNLFFIDNGRLVEKPLAGANLPFSIILFKKGPRYSVVLLDEPLARSLLVRLYFFEGKGLEHFIPFTHERDLTGRTDIYVFEIDWDGFIGSQQATNQ